MNLQTVSLKKQISKKCWFLVELLNMGVLLLQECNLLNIKGSSDGYTKILLHKNTVKKIQSISHYFIKPEC